RFPGSRDPDAVYVVAFEFKNLLVSQIGQTLLESAAGRGTDKKYFIAVRAFAVVERLFGILGADKNARHLTALQFCFDDDSGLVQSVGREIRFLRADYFVLPDIHKARC